MYPFVYIFISWWQKYLHETGSEKQQQQLVAKPDTRLTIFNFVGFLLLSDRLHYFGEAPAEPILARKEFIQRPKLTKTRVLGHFYVCILNKSLRNVIETISLATGKVIFRNLKLGGVWKLGGGSVNICKAQIYIKKHKKQNKIPLNLGESSLNWANVYLDKHTGLVRFWFAFDLFLSSPNVCSVLLKNALRCASYRITCSVVL